MEKIRRNIKLFFVTYGSLLFTIIGIFCLLILFLRGVNYVHITNKETEKEHLRESIVSEEETNESEEEILLITNFLNYCNNNNVKEAYDLLSKECVDDKYQTVQIFEKEYVNKIFTYKKEYKINKENDLYKITIIEGILQSGKLEDRENIVTYYRVQKDVLDNKIYIEE